MALTRCQQRAATKARQRAKAERLTKRLEAAKAHDVRNHKPYAGMNTKEAKKAFERDLLELKAWRGSCALGMRKGDMPSHLGREMKPSGFAKPNWKPSSGGQYRARQPESVNDPWTWAVVDKKKG